MSPPRRSAMRRHELSDAQWELIADLMPRAGRRGGGRWRDHRQVGNGLTWKRAPGAQRRGRPRRVWGGGGRGGGGRGGDRREGGSGLMWKLATGAQWRDLPERFGPWQTVYERFSRWRREGPFDRLSDRLRAQLTPHGHRGAHA